MKAAAPSRPALTAMERHYVRRLRRLVVLEETHAAVFAPYSSGEWLIRRSIFGTLRQLEAFGLGEEARRVLRGEGVRRG